MIIGILAAIPPGPLAVIILKNTLHHGKNRGIAISAGVTTMDFFYCLVFAFATGSIFTKLSLYAERFSSIILVFQVCFVIGIVFYGIYSFRNHSYPDAPTTEGTKKFAYTRKLAQHGPFFFGLGLALTQLANPTFIPFMTYLSLLAHEQGFVRPYWADYLVFAAGYALGVFTWLYTIIRLSLRYKAALPADVMLRLNRFIGLTLIGFGTYLGYRVTMLIKWADMVRLIFAL